uniref:Uncharacterized protein n=1 Tax=Rhizophora mucronata TaxID=61149 RepID=A0A2P2PHV3_RHIMU
MTLIIEQLQTTETTLLSITVDHLGKSINGTKLIIMIEIHQRVSTCKPQCN